MHPKALAPTEFQSLSLKMCSLDLSPVLVKLYNKCLACWNSSSVVPVFRDFRSTADNLAALSERICNSLDASGETRAIALDISKAFDKVWHAGLLHKLKA